MSESPLRAFLDAMDALDVEAAISLFAPVPSFTTAFGEEAVGAEQVQAVIRELFSELRGAHHDVSSEWNPQPGVWIVEMTATYELTDFSERGPYKRLVIAVTGEDGIRQIRVYGAHELPLPEEGRAYREVRGPHGWLPTL
ncbi:MAG TPA: nuclear transport factor 2 family protein [Solirubrobacteraceae bacterium]|nr:nuclear transport factor 2 family protein [Solirubrobacteraceae bacterium]